MTKILRINSAITVRNVIIVFFILTLSLIIFLLYNSTSMVWKSNTLNIVYKSENTDGGFSSLLCERKPFVYDTYYNNLFLMESKPNSENNEYLKLHLDNEQKEIKDISGLVTLYDLSYLVDLQKKCCISFNNSYKQSIIKSILKLHNRDTGLFTINNSKIIESIGITNACTKILSNLDYDLDYNNLNITINGLYEDPSIFNTSNNKWPIFNNLNAIEERTQLFNISTEKSTQFKKKLILDAKELLSKKPTDTRSLANYIPAYELLKRLNVNIQISEEFRNYLESVRNIDGGYGFLSNTSDSQLTYRIYLLFPELVSVNDYVNSIEKYRLKSGYFISREPIDSNTPNSFMALKIIKYLDGEIPSNLINYIQQASLKKTLDDPDEFYFINKALSELGLSNVSYGNISDNDSKLIIYKLITCNNIDPTEKEQVINTLKSFKKGDGGYSFTEGSNLKDTYLILLAMTYVNETDTTSALRDWLLSMHKEDGGYSSEEDSSLKDTYYVLSIMNCIRYKPQNINMIENYINSKRDNENGGFSFSQNSISSIKATFYGLESELLLKKLRTFNT